jgi:ADP-heptose:LPS heptosyltransferase
MADLHEVLRTKILRGFFRLSGLTVAVLDKGRKEKGEMTRRQDKILRPLASTFQRYADVFEKLGFPVQLSTGDGYTKIAADKELLKLKDKGVRLVGIAPFAQFKEKVYPQGKMAEVVRLLSGEPTVRVFLFGGREDVEALEELKQKGTGVEVLAGKMKLEDELKKIAALDVMISMDSANMHLASLFAVPVVSVWGGTHPWLGFYGWGQDPANAVQVELDCRPSSVFGNKECPRNLACMHGISPLLIVEKVQHVLTAQNATS